MYRNDILNFQEPTTILNACTKKGWKLIEGTTYIEKRKKKKERETTEAIELPINESIRTHGDKENQTYKRILTADTIKQKEVNEKS